MSGMCIARCLLETPVLTCRNFSSLNWFLSVVGTPHFIFFHIQLHICWERITMLIVTDFYFLQSSPIIWRSLLWFFIHSTKTALLVRPTKIQYFKCDFFCYISRKACFIWKIIIGYLLQLNLPEIETQMAKNILDVNICNKLNSIAFRFS